MYVLLQPNSKVWLLFSVAYKSNDLPLFHFGAVTLNYKRHNWIHLLLVLTWCDLPIEFLFVGDHWLQNSKIEQSGK